MAESDVPATHTIQLYSKQGLAKIVGVMNKDIRSDVKSYIDTKKGEEKDDWYCFSEDGDLLAVVDKAKELDYYAEVYNVVIGEGENIDGVGKFAVLVYVSGTVYKLCAMQKSKQKEELESYIELSVKGHKEIDWYRVDNVSQIEEIVEYAKDTEVSGTTYNYVSHVKQIMEYAMVHKVSGVIYNMVHG